MGKPLLGESILLYGSDESHTVKVSRLILREFPLHMHVHTHCVCVCGGAVSLSSARTVDRIVQACT